MDKNTEDLSWLWQKKFISKAFIGSIACALLVYIATSPLFVRQLYESEVIVYVPLTILSQQLNQQGIGFASDREIDWYIQILKSNHLADSLIRHYNLFANYKIDSAGKGSLSIIYKKLGSLINIDKTRYGSVSIRVRDYNPKRAADMANEIVVLGEVIKKNLLYSNRQEAMRYARILFEQKSNEVLQLEITLDSLKNAPPGVKKDYLYNKTLTLYNIEFQEFINRKGIYERELKNFDTPLPKAYIISSAVPAFQSNMPKRGLLIIIGAASFLLIFIVIEIIRRDNQKDL